MAPLCLTGSPIGRIERDVPRNRPLPAVAIREQAFLVVVELLGCLGRELEVWSQDDGVDRAGLLAKAAVDAFHHVDVEAGRPPRAVVASWPRLDGDGLRRADRLAQLAGDAALLSVRIAPQRKLAAKAGRERPLLERIVQRHLRLEEVAHRQEERGDEFRQKDRPDRLIEPHGLILFVASLATRSPRRSTAMASPPQSPVPGFGDNKLALSGLPSQSLASGGGSRFTVMFGQTRAYLVLMSSHFSSPGSVSGLIASTGHSGSQTPVSY